eukprot:7215498-Prymnesium_polylepis.2
MEGRPPRASGALALVKSAKVAAEPDRSGPLTSGTRVAVCDVNQNSGCVSSGAPPGRRYFARP